MHIALILGLFVFAGVINGSFAIFIKYIKGWEYENIWFHYSLWTYLIVPWVFILIVTPQVFEIYAAAPPRFILIIVVGGIVFGIGQICLAYAFHTVGLGLGFILNIGLSTALGSMFPLLFQDPEDIPTVFGIVIIIGILFAIISLIICTIAGNLRDKAKKGIIQKEHTHAKKGFLAGVILGLIAGVISAWQNFSFSLTEGLQTIALEHGAIRLGADNIIWPLFQAITFISYGGYMLYLFKKNHTFRNYSQPGTKKYLLFGPLMALCAFGSIIIYSVASGMIGDLGPVVGWPLFMIFIILTSNFWVFFTKEWQGVSRRILSVILSGIALLVVAVVFLVFAGSLQ